MPDETGGKEADFTTPREEQAANVGAVREAERPGDEGMRWQPGEPVEADRLAGELNAQHRDQLKQARSSDPELRRAAQGGSTSTIASGPKEQTDDAAAQIRQAREKAARENKTNPPTDSADGNVG